MMKIALLSCVLATATAGAELEFKNGGKTCSMFLSGDSSGNPVVKNACGFSTKSLYSDNIGTVGHSNIARSLTSLHSKVKTLETKHSALQTEVDQTQSDLTQMTFDMIADVWCGSKQNFGANTHAVRVKQSGVRTCDAWCAYASKDIYYHGRKYTWKCLAGSTRIAPDFAHKYTHIGQSYGGPHKGNWASYYWAQGCGTTANGNGQTYCCCRG
jgi:hypothetical protein